MTNRKNFWGLGFVVVSAFVACAPEVRELGEEPGPLNEAGAGADVGGSGNAGDTANPGGTANTGGTANAAGSGNAGGTNPGGSGNAGGTANTGGTANAGGSDEGGSGGDMPNGGQPPNGPDGPDGLPPCQESLEALCRRFTCPSSPADLEDECGSDYELTRADQVCGGSAVSLFGGFTGAVWFFDANGNLAGARFSSDVTHTCSDGHESWVRIYGATCDVHDAEWQSLCTE